MAEKEDLKFYLTASEPNVSQSNYAQSIGGYPSTTDINPSYILASILNRESTEFLTTLPMVTADSILINDEFMSITSLNSYVTNVTRQAFNTDGKFHLPGDRVYSINKTLFNNSYSISNKQYRCIAITNIGSDIFSDVKFYFKSASRNVNTAVKLGIEIPQVELLDSTATGGNSISLIDTSLIGTDVDYENCYLVITSGNNLNIGRKIATFDSLTGTFTFTQAFANLITDGTEYRVENSPSSRLITGINEPPESDYFSGFSTPVDFDSGLSIDINGLRDNGENLYPNETVYLWIERIISSDAVEYTDNRVVLTCAYRN